MQAYSQLSAAERWNLAFYVLSLRYAGSDLAAGKRLFEHTPGTLPSSARALALLTDEDLARQLPSAASDAERAQLLGYLRVETSFRAESANAGNSMQLARRELHAGLAAYRAGDTSAARHHFVSAYLDGFEPHEAAISAHDRALVHQVEATMLALRKAAAQGEKRAQLEHLVRETDALLMRAEDHRDDGTTALIGALTIALREGLEITLLIGALLGLVRKRGLPELVRYVHAGWLLAAASGLLTFWAVGELLSGLQRELAEGIATLVAALLLLGVTHWLLGQLSAKRFMGFLAARMGEAASRRTALGVLGLTFLAAYREAFEVVLFFKALLLDAGPHQNRVWLGAGAGLLALALIATVLQRIGQRLQPRRFMLASSVLLALLVFALAGNGVHALQEAAVVGITPIAFPELSLLGMHASAETLTTQACVLLFLIGSALWPLLRQRPDSSSAAVDEKPAGQAAE
jgi:high-affinity iron transporter